MDKLNKQKKLSDLLTSISGVLIFISLAHWLDTNGFGNFAIPIILLGVLMMFYPEPFVKRLEFIQFISRRLVFTVSHILIFIGSKTYFNLYIDQYWVWYLVVGIIILNTARNIARTLFPNQETTEHPTSNI